MSVHYCDDTVTLHHGDALDVARGMPDGSVDCIVTSPPYFGLRDYGEPGQYGLESSPAEYVDTMRALFGELRRVLADDGTLWLNLGDSYSSRSEGYRRGASAGASRHACTVVQPSTGLPEKNLMGIPWRVAFAMQDDGWILRNDIIWSKPNAMPESVTDRLSKRHEHVFLLTKSSRYWLDLDPIRVAYDGDRAETRRTRTGATNKQNSIARAWDPAGHPGGQGRNPGDVWTIPTQPFPGAHFAAMPLALAERCIRAGCKPGGTVLDPFSGSGTTGLAAARHGRRYVGIDLSREYLDLSLRTRLTGATIDFEAAQ